MKQAQAAWIDMTSAERLQWQQFTTYSNPKIRRDKHVTMSGYSLYIKYQVSRLMAGLSIQDTLQYIAFPTWYYPTLVYKDAPLLYLATDAPPEEPIGDIFIIFMVSTPRRATLKYSPHGLRFCACVGAWWENQCFNVDYLANFGALPVYDDILHYSYQVFSSVTPIFSNIRTGTLVVTAL
jgi:hypothetical protein